MRMADLESTKRNTGNWGSDEPARDYMLEKVVEGLADEHERTVAENSYLNSYTYQYAFELDAMTPKAEILEKLYAAESAEGLLGFLRALADVHPELVEFKMH